MLNLQKGRKEKKLLRRNQQEPLPEGNEHIREIREGVTTHPLVTHFREEHSGHQQEILMRVLSKHITPLDRPVKESLNIAMASRNAEECLHFKSEWVG